MSASAHDVQAGGADAPSLCQSSRHVSHITTASAVCPVHEAVIPVKDIWLYPLRKDFRAAFGR